MFKRLIFTAVLWLIAWPALAQNPTCPTRPLGDDSNACASTAFVQDALAGSIPLLQNHILVGNASNIATDVAMSGDCTIVASGAITCNPVYTAPYTGGVAETQRNYNAQRVSIVDFGAIGDGNISNASTNATALTNALATGKCAFIPYTSSGYHFGTNLITVGTGQCIIGENQVVLKSTTTSYFLHVTSFETTAAPAVIENLTINMSGAGGSSTAIRFATASGVVAGAQISKILCLNAVECIGDESHATNYVLDVKLSDIRCELTLGRQVYIRRSRGFMWIDTVRIDQTQAGQTTPVTWEGGRFEDLVGLEINRWDSVGPVTTTFQAGQTGLVINGAGSGQASVWLNRVLVDNTSGHGITISNINYLNANWIESFQNLGNAITLSTVTQSELTNVYAYGGVGLTGAAAGANGFACSACISVLVSNLYSTLNTGQGLSISGASSGVTINNYQGTNNTGFGILFANSAENLLVSGGVLSGNTAGLLSDTATGKNRIIRNVAGFPLSTGVADANYTAIVSDDKVRYASISTARTVTLPAASLYEQGRVLTIEDASGSATSTVTISAAPNGTDTINGSNTTQVVVNSAYGRSELESNGSNGWIVQKIGEYIESNIASGSSVSLTTATPANITSISLTAGDWDVDANCQFAGGATTTVLYLICSLSQTSATLDATNGRQVGIVYNNVAIYNLIAGGTVSQVIPPLRFSLASTTTIYLVAQESFGVSTATAFGILRARRVR